MKNKTTASYIYFFLAILGLFLAFVFQNFDMTCLRVNADGFYHYNHLTTDKTSFVINKILRFILNSLSGITIVSFLFENISFTKNIALVQLLIFVFVLPLFFYLAFSDVALLNNLYQKLNAIIINPVIIFILSISYFFYHKKNK